MLNKLMKTIRRDQTKTRELWDADLRRDPGIALEYLHQVLQAGSQDNVAHCLRRLLFTWHPASPLSAEVLDGFRACLGQLRHHSDPSVRTLAMMLEERMLGQ